MIPHRVTALLLALLLVPSAAPAQEMDELSRKALQHGNCVLLEPRDAPPYTHLAADGQVLRWAAPASPATQAGGEFCVRAGLADPRHVSVEAKNSPGSFLRVRDGQVLVETRGDRRFDEEATFALHATTDPTNLITLLSLEPLTRPGHFAVSRPDRTVVEPGDASGRPGEMAVFVLVPVWDGRTGEPHFARRLSVEARAACLRDGGKLDARFSGEFCNRATGDAGKPCVTSLDCQGYCRAPEAVCSDHGPSGCYRQFARAGEISAGCVD